MNEKVGTSIQAWLLTAFVCLPFCGGTVGTVGK